MAELRFPFGNGIVTQSLMLSMMIKSVDKAFIRASLHVEGK
jgi:hypothetical protein